MAERCGERYEQHPSLPHLVAECALPKDHEGPHDNRLTKGHEQSDDGPDSSAVALLNEIFGGGTS